MATLGYSTIGTAGTENWNGPYFGCKFTPTEDGDITKIWVYCSYPFGAGDYDFKVAVYTESGGEWDVKAVEATSAVKYNATAKWMSVDISYAITNGTPIYLAAFGESGFAVPYDAGAAAQTLSKWSATYPTFENPDSGIEIDTFSRVMSIYAEYTPSGGGGLAFTKRTGVLKASITKITGTPIASITKITGIS